MSPGVTLQRKTRIAWVDYYKAMVIILVVLGHATGLFNPYIYQFHMAAFFFASGYLDTTEKKSWLKLIVEKFFSLWLPLFTFVVIFSGAELLLVRKGLYATFFQSEYPGFWERVRNFVVRGTCGTPVLGACWFVVTLMGILLLQKGILCLTGGKKGIPYVLISGVLFLVAYGMIEGGNTFALGPFRMDLVLLGSFYYSCGTLFKRIPYTAVSSQNVKPALHLAMMAVNLVLFWYFCHVRINLVDWPSRTFNTPFWDLLAAANGSLFVWNCAMLMQFAPRRIQRVVSYIGKNTLGIVIFHFLMIKITLVVACLAGIIFPEDVSAIVPTTEMGNRYWLPITVFSVLGSLGVWQVLSRIPGVRFCIGQQKTGYQKIYSAMAEKKVCRQISVITQNWYGCYLRFLERLVKHWMAVVVVCVVLGISGVFTAVYLRSGADTPAEFVQLLQSGDKVSWVEGKYEDDWVMPYSQIKCSVFMHDTLVMEGYYPGEITGDQRITVLVDGVEVDSVLLHDNTFTISETFSGPGTYQVELSCDFTFDPANGDVRTLGFTVSEIRQE